MILTIVNLVEGIVKTIKWAIEDLPAIIEGAKYAASILKDAMTTYVPTTIQSACLVIISIAVLYKVLGREG